MNMKSPNRGIFETVLLLVVFVAVFVFMANSYMMEQRVYKEKALLYELELLRQGVSTFSMVEKRKPDSLVELASTVYSLPDDSVKRHFVGKVIVNDKGQIIDPFGHPYAYNKSKGWVSSATSGYKKW